MKNVKRIVALLMALCLMSCLCACATEEGTSDTTTTQAPTTQAPTTEEPSKEPTNDEKPTEPVKEPTYTVTVVDQDNNPVAGAIVQLCLETCSPAATNEQGVAEFFLEENDYKVGFTVMPAGYEYSSEEQEWHFADGENSLTIVINKIAAE